MVMAQSLFKILRQQQPNRAIDVLAPGGGYILSPGHPSLQVDIPIENIVAMYDTVREYGRYAH